MGVRVGVQVFVCARGVGAGGWVWDRGVKHLILTASPSALVTTVSAVGKGSKCLALKEAAVVIMITRSQA